MSHEQQTYTLSQEQKSTLFAGITRRSDLIFRNFLMGNFIFGLFLAGFYDTWFVAIGVGGLSLLAYFLTKILLPEYKLYQYVGATILGVFMAQFIYQMHGLFEMHFTAFVACALLITYSNWRIQVPLFAIIVIHHAVFAYLQFAGVEGIYFTQLPYMDITTFLFHAGLAGVIIFICGMWGYFQEKKIIADGIRALAAEEALSRNLELAEAIKKGDYDSLDQVTGDDRLSHALRDMGNHLQVLSTNEACEKYVNQGIAKVNDILSGITPGEQIPALRHLLAEVSKYLGINQAALFLAQEDAEGKYLQLAAGYAFSERKSLKNRILKGEGLIGQVALEMQPVFIKNLPADYLVIESGLGYSRPNQVVAWPLTAEKELVGVLELALFGELNAGKRRLLEEIAPRIGASIDRVNAQEKTQNLLEEAMKLKAELLSSNEQLEAQKAELLDSRTELQVQQKRLLEANAELEAQTAELESQKKVLLEQHEKMELARNELKLQTEELEKANQYKSEFLANMSHELRTPLNSILILADLLSQNKGKRLTKKEVEHARVIHTAGSDLLVLINDILDLSKIEAGKLDMIFEEVEIREIADNMRRCFDHVAEEKGVNFMIHTGDHLPENFTTDRVRLEQIIKNLLSNAIKFTPANGDISLNFSRVDKETEILAISVRDTGIGIPPEKQAHIFEAFRQADGSTNRKYGGTGLGLSISMQLSSLLGGRIELESEEGKGSEFTLYLPFEASAERPGDNTSRHRQLPVRTFDKHSGRVLIVEDQEIQNETIASLLDRNGFEYIQAYDGEKALELLEREKNIDCVLLDLNLPGKSGIEVLELIRNNKDHQEVPVIIHTAMDIDRETHENILQFTQSVIVKATQSGKRLIDEINHVLGWPNSIEETVSSEPVGETAEVAPLDEISGVPEAELENFLKGKTILLVDDDMRNIFSVSVLLESYQIQIEAAGNGLEALEYLETRKAPDLILMDIMMPGMDGLEATRRIRENKAWRNIPVIALTAKAMKKDREECLAAGATEYLPKPLDTRLLISTIYSCLKKENQTEPTHS